VCVSALSGCRQQQQQQQQQPPHLQALGRKHHRVAGSIIIITISIIKKEKIAKIVEAVVEAEVIL
jgi:hypothetical protein